MYCLAFLYPLLLLHVPSFAGALKENPEEVPSLTANTHYLENRLSSLESESKKSNQDQAAILASTKSSSAEAESKAAISQLTSTSDEVSVVKDRAEFYSPNNYTAYMHQLEQKLSTLESQSKVNDQKYATVLSSILSKLTSTTDELSVVKANLTSTSNELSVVKAKLTSTTDELSVINAKLKSTCTNNNITFMHGFEQKLSTLETQSKGIDRKYGAVVSSILSNLTSTTDELTMVKTQMNLTSIQLNSNTDELRSVKAQLDSNTSFLEHGVGFEASLSAPQTLHIQGSKALTFNTVSVNIGGGYNQASGVFTAPISGTYLLWFNIFFTDASSTSYELDVTLMVSNHAVTSAATQIRHSHVNFPGSHVTSPVSGVVNGIYIVLISRGETVYLQTNLRIRSTVKEHSSFGGVLISSHS